MNEYVWTKVDPRNKPATALHAFHMFGDYCRYSKRVRTDPIDEKIFKGIYNVLFDHGIVPVSGETLKIVADHVDFLNERCTLLSKRIQELENE